MTPPCRASLPYSLFVFQESKRRLPCCSSRLFLYFLLELCRQICFCSGKKRQDEAEEISTSMLVIFLGLLYPGKGFCFLFFFLTGLHFWAEDNCGQTGGSYNKFILLKPFCTDIPKRNLGILVHCVCILIRLQHS